MVSDEKKDNIVEGSQELEQLLTEIIVRLSALESLIVEKKLVSADELMDQQKNVIANLLNSFRSKS